MRKKFLYRYTSGPKLLRWNFPKFLRYPYEVVCSVHKLFPLIFGLFAIFDCNFTEFVVPSSEENENHVLPLKGQSLLKKSENRIKIEP